MSYQMHPTVIIIIIKANRRALEDLVHSLVDKTSVEVDTTDRAQRRAVRHHLVSDRRLGYILLHILHHITSILHTHYNTTNRHYIVLILCS